MQFNRPFPLTLTLSPRERESVTPVSEGSLNGELFPVRRNALPLLGERVGARGNGGSRLNGYALAWFTLIAALVSSIPGLVARGAETQAPALVLASKGRTDFSIVVPAKASPTEELAARELQRYLGALSGAEFGITSTPAPYSILVCKRDSAPAGIILPATVAHLPAEGYCLSVREGSLLLIGADERGMLYAVYDLLERLGCRWLAPAFPFYAGAHEVVPKRETLSLSLSKDVIEQPALKYRKLYVEEGHSHNTTNLLQMIEWMPKRRFNTLVVPLNYAGGGRVMWDNWRKELTPELLRRGIWIEVGGHGYENYLNAGMEGGQLFERHPEWFDMDGQGKRIKSAHAVFCTSNREAKDYFTRSVMRYLDSHPEIQIFDFWPPDGAKWCQCANCKALGSPSDRQALLLGEVSGAVHKTRPDVRFETIAYAACVAPPVKAAMDPGVLVDFCPIGQCFEVQINDAKSEKNADYVRQLTGWLNAFKGDVSIYSYYRKYAWRSLANLIPHYIQNDLRFYRDLGVRGISSYAEPGDWGAYELNHYVLGGLAWNPDADVDATIAEFAQGRFGAQAALGRKAYQVLEDNVRHVCSLPGTELKTPVDYQRAGESLRALAREVEAARASASDRAVGAALNRLGLAVEYVLRDLSLQQARVAKGAASDRQKMINDLARFLQEHPKDGVFIAERIPVAKQAARYGLPKE
jgi:hypothetical protein